MAEQTSADRSIYDPVTEAHVDEIEAQSLCDRCHYAPGSLELEGLCLGCWQHVQARALRLDLQILRALLTPPVYWTLGTAREAQQILESALANPLLEGADDG